MQGSIDHLALANMPFPFIQQCYDNPAKVNLYFKYKTREY